MLNPPKDIPPERLFRTLLQVPRPELPIAYRLRGFEDLPLAVRALSTWELSDACEGSHYSAEMIARALIAGPPGARQRVFTSADELEAVLDEGEASGLSREVQDSLSSLPAYGFANVRTWAPYLEQGAAHPMNQHEAYALGSCTDIAMGVERPDLYFGVSLNQLIDCHWMAYRAAHAFFRKVTTPNDTKT